VRLAVVAAISVLAFAGGNVHLAGAASWDSASWDSASWDSASWDSATWIP
jgi:hypothetical protein